MGDMAEPVLKRVAEVSDGCFPQFQPGDEASHTLDRCARTRARLLI